MNCLRAWILYEVIGEFIRNSCQLTIAGEV